LWKDEQTVQNNNKSVYEKNIKSFIIYDSAKIDAFENDDWLHVIWYELCEIIVKFKVQFLISELQIIALLKKKKKSKV
jgi:hypothetical protein